VPYTIARSRVGRNKKREIADIRSLYITLFLLFQHTTTIMYSHTGVYRMHQ
jgi:hypothetical protein